MNENLLYAMCCWGFAVAIILVGGFLIYKQKWVILSVCWISLGPCVFGVLGAAFYAEYQDDIEIELIIQNNCVLKNRVVVPAEAGEDELVIYRYKCDNGERWSRYLRK